MTVVWHTLTVQGRGGWGGGGGGVSSDCNKCFGVRISLRGKFEDASFLWILFGEESQRASTLLRTERLRV